MHRICAVAAWMGLLVASEAAMGATARTWILQIDHRNGGGWNEETSGGYPGTHNGHYWWASDWDGVRRAYWRFDGSTGTPFAPTDPEINNTTEEPPDEPRLYLVDTWVPTAHSSTYSVLEVDTLWPMDPGVPWLGAFGQNKQWITRGPSDQGTWVPAGINPAPGPQAPLILPGKTNAVCDAGRTGAALWLKRGDWLYVKWDFADPELTQGVSAIRLTEVNPVPPIDPACATATFGGPVDLGCSGNADPLYGVGASRWWDSASAEPFASSDAKMIAMYQATLAVDGYRMPCTTRTPVTPGLPADGNFIAQLGSTNVPFKLRYDGFSTLKWLPGQISGPFSQDHVAVLNATPGREFVPGAYRELYILSAKTGNDSQMTVQLVYGDNSTETYSYRLYDWFNNDGDATSIAVGVGGTQRSSGAGTTGFRQLTPQGQAGGGGDHSGAFLFVHPVAVNSTKVLSRVQIGVAPDDRGFGGNLNVLAVSMVSTLCNIPSVDANGDGAVDSVDFARFQACMTETAPISPTECQCFDRSGPSKLPDGMVDSYDFAWFQGCATGPALPWTPTPDCPN